MYYSLPFIGHYYHTVGVPAVGGVVVRGVQQPLLLGALLRGNGGAEEVAARVQLVGGAAQKLAVTVAVVGVDIFDVEIDAVVVFQAKHGEDVLEQRVLRGLIREQRVGDLAGEAAGAAEIGHGQQRRCIVGICRRNHPRVLYRKQSARRIRLITKRAEKRQIRHGLRHYCVRYGGVSVGVYLYRASVRRAAARNEQRHAGHKPCGVVELVYPRQLRRVRSVPAGDAVKAVSAAHNIYLHKLSFHDLRLLIYYIYS